MWRCTVWGEMCRFSAISSLVRLRVRPRSTSSSRSLRSVFSASPKSGLGGLSGNTRSPAMVRSITWVREMSEYSLNQKLSMPASQASWIHWASAVEVVRMIRTPGLLQWMVLAQVRPSSPYFIITSMITRSTGCARQKAMACSAPESEAAKA